MHERNRRIALVIAALCAFAAVSAFMHERWAVAITQAASTIFALGYWRWNLYWWGKAVCPPAPVRQRPQETLDESTFVPIPGPHAPYYGVRCDKCDDVTFVGQAPRGEGYVPEVVCDWCGATTVTRPDNIWWTDLGPEGRSRMKH